MVATALCGARRQSFRVLGKASRLTHGPYYIPVANPLSVWGAAPTLEPAKDRWPTTLSHREKNPWFLKPAVVEAMAKPRVLGLSQTG